MSPRKKPFVTVRGALLAAFLFLLAGCTRPFAAAITPSSSCGSPSALDPRFHFAVAGPLVFAGGLGTTHAIVGDFAPGIPAKVGITALHPLTTALTLKGWDCATAQRLRFWYHPGSNPFASVPVSPSQLAATGIWSPAGEIDSAVSSSGQSVGRRAWFTSRRIA